MGVGKVKEQLSSRWQCCSGFRVVAAVLPTQGIRETRKLDICSSLVQFDGGQSLDGGQSQRASCPNTRLTDQYHVGAGRSCTSRGTYRRKRVGRTGHLPETTLKLYSQRQQQQQLLLFLPPSHSSRISLPAAMHAGKRATTAVSRAALRCFSQSMRSEPRWLQTVLNDSAPPPRPYAWTIDNLGGHNKAQPVQRHDDARRVYILGVGNLGRLYATCLAQLSEPPPITLVLHRRSLLEHWASDAGIEMTRYGVLERLSSFDIEWWTDQRPIHGPVREIAHGDRISNLIVATKAAHAIPQTDRLRRYLDASSNVLFVQNGMNKLWPPYGDLYSGHRWPGANHPNFLHGVTMHGVFSEGPFTSVHAAPADVVIGPVHPNQTPSVYLTKLITTAPHLAGRAVSRSELWVLQLEKLVINVIINPLTAILRVRNGALFEDPKGEMDQVMDKLLRQTSNVFQALVKHPSSQAIFSNSELSQNDMLQRLSTSSLREMLYRVGAKVKQNKSSMFQDVETGRQTEIQDLNGWLIETAQLLDQDLDVDCHKTLVDLVEQGVRLDQAALATRLLA